MKRLAAFLGLCRALPALILAQTNDSTLRPVAFQSGIEQAALGQQADQLARDVATLMDELQRNGFPAESLTGLTSLVGQLEAVGGADMKPLADRLRRVAESSGGDLRAAVADAYRDQQSIELRLASLSRQLVVQQLRADAIRQLELLIGRQLAAQRETRTLGSTANRPADRVNLLESDQAAIGTELAGFFQTGETLLSRLQDNDPAAALNGTSPVNSPNFAERVNAPYLTTLSDEALAAVKAGKFPEAFARQAALLAEFRRILDGVLASQPVTQRLASALQQLEALKQEQAALAADPAPNAAAQQALADEAQLLAQQVAPVSPAAAEAMTKAQAAMLPSPPPPAGTPPRPQRPPRNPPPPNKPSLRPKTPSNNNSLKLRPPTPPKPKRRRPTSRPKRATAQAPPKIKARAKAPVKRPQPAPWPVRPTASPAPLVSKPAGAAAPARTSVSWPPHQVRTAALPKRWAP